MGASAIEGCVGESAAESLSLGLFFRIVWDVRDRGRPLSYGGGVMIHSLSGLVGLMGD